MKKEKVAFVVVRYGKNINGGAEYHCQMLAERLVSDYDVEVLTTWVRDVATGENIYPEGEEEWNGVVIRRFRTNPVQREKERYFAKKAKPARKLRQFLFKLGILKYLSSPNLRIKTPLFLHSISHEPPKPYPEYFQQASVPLRY